VRSRIIAVVVVVTAIVVVGILGYAVAGFAYASSRVADADRSLNTVISHQNNLNTTFKDIDKQFNGLSSSSGFDAKQSRMIWDKFVANAKAAGITVDKDDASLISARTGLEREQWLTAFNRSGLAKEAERIDHARKALASAKSITADYVKDGEFFQAYLDGLTDFDAFLTQSANGELAAAKVTLPNLKSNVDKALELSTAPGLPSEVQSLMVDLQKLAADLGTLLDARIAGDTSGIVRAGKSVEADGTKISAYDFVKIQAGMRAYFKPRIDAFNLEMAKATAA
jgi:hypothetical protein